MNDINTNAICPHCGGNDAVYDSLIADHHCQLCGEWFESDHQDQEQRYKCNTCQHISTESELGVACAQYNGQAEYRLFCDNCGSVDLAWTD